MRHPSLLVACALLLAAAPAAFAQVPPAPSGAARVLPSRVLSAFEKAHPNAVITSADQDRQEGKIVFRVDALDKGRRQVIVYDLSGTVIEAAAQVDEKDLPAPVAAAIREHKGATFVKAMKITRGINAHYELTLRGTRKATMIVKADGAVIAYK